MTRTTARERRERFRPTRPYLATAVTVNVLTVALWLHTRDHATTVESVLVWIGYTITFALVSWSLWMMHRLSR